MNIDNQTASQIAILLGLQLADNPYSSLGCGIKLENGKYWDASRNRVDAEQLASVMQLKVEAIGCRVTLTRMASNGKIARRASVTADNQDQAFCQAVMHFVEPQ